MLLLLQVLTLTQPKALFFPIKMNMTIKLITGWSPNTDEVQPPKITTSPGEDVWQAVCHIRAIGRLKRKMTNCNKLLIQSKGHGVLPVYSNLWIEGTVS